MKKAIALLFIALICTLHGLELFSNYGDHMVLQRNKPVKIAGRAPEGSVVTVKFDIPGLQGSAVSDKSGEWCVTLPAQPAGGPYRITVTDGKETIRIEDVLFGEVWICSGQSNMEFPLWGSYQFFRQIGGDRIAAQAPLYPRIRLFQTPKFTSPTGEYKEPNGEWTLPVPGKAERFSALGYLFGRQLFMDLNVPVGLIQAAWGGTPIRSYISLDALREGGQTELVAQAEEIRNYISSNAHLTAEEKIALDKKRISEFIKRWSDKFYGAVPEDVRAAAARWAQPEFDDSAWKKLAPTPKETFTMEETIGIFWLRTEVEIPAYMEGKELELYLGAIDETDVTWFNGVKVGAIDFDVINFWACKRKYTIPASAVKAGRAVIAIRYANSSGASGLEHDKLYLAVKGDADRKVFLDRGWRWQKEYEIPKAAATGRPDPSGNLLKENSPYLATTLYNAMLAPWKRYPVRGEIWYQGEADTWQSQNYFQLQQLMVADRRKQWNDPEYGFFWCQLSSFIAHNPTQRGKEPVLADMDPNANNSWCDFREMQQALLDKITNSGMAVSIDCGDAYDVHPCDKSLLAFRLAKEAERVFFGYQGVTAGPRYASHEISGNEVIIRFSNVGAGLVTNDGKELAGFAVAGEDGKFVWAKAEIRDNTVVVSSPQVAKPVYVRYAWLNYPDGANLANADGFPASPFRTNPPEWLAK